MMATHWTTASLRTEGTGSTAMGSRSWGAGATAALLPVLQGHEVEVCDLHRWPDLGREGDSGEGALPPTPPIPSPPLPRHSGHPTKPPAAPEVGDRGRGVEGPGLAAPARGTASVALGREGCGPACGRASTYAVVGQQRVCVVLGEKGGSECPELPRCPPAAVGTQPCRAAGEALAAAGRGRGCPGWPGPVAGPTAGTGGNGTGASPKSCPRPKVEAS